jgi:hypothetical protein
MKFLNPFFWFGVFVAWFGTSVDAGIEYAESFKRERERKYYEKEMKKFDKTLDNDKK